VAREKFERGKPVATELAAVQQHEKAETQNGLITNTWNGLPNYVCRGCGFASLDKTMAEMKQQYCECNRGGSNHG
jgi:hypothetical protein